MSGNAKNGWIEVIIGSMFAGKTQELIRRLRLAQIAGQRVQVLKHSLDARYETEFLVSHDQNKIPSAAVKSADEILKIVKPDTRVVGIDEVHFFDDRIVNVCDRLANQGKRVVCAGLDLDYRARPFMNVARLVAKAEYVTKNLAICVICGEPASRSFRKSSGKSRIDVGHTNKYEARCRTCFNLGNKV